MDVIEEVKQLLESSRSQTAAGCPLPPRDQTKVLGKKGANDIDYTPHAVQNSRGVEQLDAEELKQVFEHLSPRSQQLLLAMFKELAESEGISITSGHPPAVTDLSTAIPLWEDDLSSRGYSNRSIQTYSYWIKRTLDTIPQPTYLALTHYLAEQRKRGIAANTLKMMTKALKSFFGFLHEQGLIRQNPTQKLRYPKVPRREPIYPEKEEVEKMLAAIGQSKLLDAKDKLKVALLILLPGGTGIRFTELAELPWDNVNFDRQEIKVMGKGGKERAIPLLPIIAGLLSRWKPYSPGDLVFPSGSKYGRIDPSVTNRMLKRLAKRAGVRPFSIHKLRHYFATYALASGADLKIISEILGHASIAITGDIYRHVLTGEVGKTMAKFSPAAGITLALPEGKGEKNGKNTRPNKGC